MRHAFALTLTLALALPCGRADAEPWPKQLHIGVASAGVACVLFLGIWGVSRMAQRGNPPDAATPEEAETTKAPVDEFLQKASAPEQRRAGLSADTGVRVYLIYEGRLYSVAPERPRARLERDPSDGNARIRKVVAAGDTVVVLLEDGSARQVVGGDAWTRIAENVTDITAENGALWVSVSNQRLRYEDGRLFADD